MPRVERLDPNPPEGDELILRRGIRAWTGWSELRVERSIETCCGAFSVRYYDPRPLLVAPEDEVSLSVGFDPTPGEGWREVPVMQRGRVDAVRFSDGPGGSPTEIAGRDLSSDLVDCSVTEGTEWTGLDVIELARALAKPYGVQVVEGVLKTAGPRFEPFRVNVGESAFQAIERACRRRGLLAFSNTAGELVIERAGPRNADTDLVWGDNLLEAKLEYSHASRFRTYLVRGHGIGANLDLAVTPQAFPSGSASDPQIGFQRKLLLLAEGPVTSAEADDRAAWEATVRAARSARLTVRVQGWRQWAEGLPWQINELVRVVIPHRRIDRRFLITAVRFTRTAEGGTTTELVLARPDAFRPQKVIPEDQQPFEAFLSAAEDS